MNILYRVANKAVRHTSWYSKVFWGGANKFWDSIPFGLDVINLGSGAGVNAFNYDGLSVKGANWALGPQSLVHDYNILKNYFSYIREGGIVIITVCPFSGLVTNYGKSHNFKYYTFLHPATITDFDEDERQRALRYKLNPFKEMPFSCVKQIVLETLRPVKEVLKPTKRVNLQHSAIQIMNGWQKQFGIEDLSIQPSRQHIKEIESRRSVLAEMVSFCNERSLKPYIVIPVFFQSLVSLFPDNFNKNYIDRLTADISAPILNYMCDEMGKNDSFFKTAMFLNEVGAHHFTNKVLKDIGLI